MRRSTTSPKNKKALLDASLAEVERGEFFDGDEVIAELRQRRGLA